MSTTTTPELTHRSLAMLRAVAARRAEMTVSCEPDLFIDGLPCDYVTAHALARAGLIRCTTPALVGRRAQAELTDRGWAALTSVDSASCPRSATQMSAVS